MNEMNLIREMLNNRSKKIYREAIISESLSLFDDAKEKLQRYSKYLQVTVIIIKRLQRNLKIIWIRYDSFKKLFSKVSSGTLSSS